MLGRPPTSLILPPPTLIPNLVHPKANWAVITSFLIYRFRCKINVDRYFCVRWWW